jgi:hypothetical protein
MSNSSCLDSRFAPPRPRTSSPGSAQALMSWLDSNSRSRRLSTVVAGFSGGGGILLVTMAFFWCWRGERHAQGEARSLGSAFEARTRWVRSRKPRSPASSTREVGAVRVEVSGTPLTYGSRMSGLWRAEVLLGRGRARRGKNEWAAHRGFGPRAIHPFSPFLFLIFFPSLFLPNSNFNLNLNLNYVAICLQIKCPLKHGVILFIFKILFFSFLYIFKSRI